MTNIYDLTYVLKEVSEVFQATVVDAEKTKKEELEVLEKGYIPNSEPYKEKQAQIELDYDVSIVKARKKAAEKAGEAIEELRDWEISRVGRIDEVALAKINVIKDVPLTTNELRVILNKHGVSNYWVQRSIAAIAESNGIPQTDLNIDSSLDTKLGVLDGLNNQLEKMLEHFTLDPKRSDRESMHARWLYLNDDILQNSINIYSNNLHDISEADAATKAFYKIKGTSGQMQKGVMIANAMRNLKKEDAKNMLFYRLAMDDSIKSEAYQVSGIVDAISEWKHGKAERYAKAIKMADELKMVNDAERIKEKLRTYINRVEMGSEPKNEFLRHEITKTYKKNTLIGKALEEMSRAEKAILFSNSGEPEDVTTN